MVEEKVRSRGKCNEETERKSLLARRQDDPEEGRRWAPGKGAALQEGTTDLYRNGESD